MRLPHRIVRGYAAEPLSARRAMRVMVAATTLTVLVGGVVIRAVDARSIPNVGVGMWWALQTVTTVGYGDVVPGTAIGRLIGSMIMLESIAFLAIVTAWVTSSFVRRAQLERGPRAAGPADPDGPDTHALLRSIDARLRRIEQALEADPHGPRPGA